MSRILIVTWDGAGNLVSTLGIARRLVQRGHDVRLMGHPAVRDRCGDHGWDFRPFVHTPVFDSAVAWNVEDEMSVLSEQLWFSGSVARDVIDEIEREPADLLIADCMLFGAMSAGEALGVTTVALFHTAVAGFRGGPMVELLAPVIPGLNQVRAELGLAPVEAICEVHDACALGIAATLQEFEPPMPMPPNVRFVGPILDGPALSTRVEQVDVAPGDEPLVVVSMSTSYQGQQGALQTVVDALASLPVRAVVTTGPSIDPASIIAAANTTVVQFASHQELFAEASLVITHAGLGTVVTALSAGVPLLCIPMGRDQFFNAGTVTALGAGAMLGPDADGDAIAAATTSALHSAELRAGAGRIATLIGAYGGATEAVAALEAAIGPVPAVAVS